MRLLGWIRLPERLSLAWHVASVLVALLLVASAAVAGVLVSYNTTSSSALSLKAPPVVWQAGPDASGNNFVADWTLSDNATWYSVSLRPIPEANVTWQNLTTLTNSDTSGYAVTVTADSVAAYAKILDFRIEFYGYGNDTLMGGLNLRDASPTSGPLHLAADASYYTKMYAKLDDGTGQQDLPSSVAITLSITP